MDTVAKDFNKMVVKHAKLPKSLSNSNSNKPIRKWYNNITVQQYCYGLLAEKYKRIDQNLTNIFFSLNTITYSMIFAVSSPLFSNESVNSAFLVYFSGFISTGSTFLLATINYFKYGKLGEQHRLAHKICNTLRFRLENICGNNFVDDGKIDLEELNNWFKEYDEFLDSSPFIPPVILHSAKNMDPS